MFKWDPEIGSLFSREVWAGSETIEIHLGYTSMGRKYAQAGLVYTVILEQIRGVTHPGLNAVTVDYASEKEEFLSETYRVIRKPATDQDIKKLLSSWNPKAHLSPEDWIERVVRNSNLTLVEKQRLSGIAAQYAEHPLNRR